MRWKATRDIRDSAAMADRSDPALTEMMRVPEAEPYDIDVPFAALGSADERDCLDQLPASFALPEEGSRPIAFRGGRDPVRLFGVPAVAEEHRASRRQGAHRHRRAGVVTLVRLTRNDAPARIARSPVDRDRR